VARQQILVQLTDWLDAAIVAGYQRVPSVDDPWIDAAGHGSIAPSNEAPR
jgi:hypothetical protein